MKNFKNKNLPILLVGVILFLFASNVNAQKKAEFGIRYMPNVSSFELNTSSGGIIKGEATIGYGIGAFLGINFTDHVGMQVEMIYSSISQKYKEVDVEREINLKYINIPVLLSLNTNKSGPVNLNLVGGPQLGLNVGSSVNTSGGDGTYTTEARVKVKPSDLGFAYGAGIDFGLNDAKTIRLGLGFRGVLGLIDISDDNETVVTDSYYVISRTTIKTYSAYMGLSILF